MASNIPVIVQGNSFSLAIPLQIYYINGDQMDLQDYTPDPTDEVSVQLKGSRRNYTYTPTIDGNIANIGLTGNELADNYSVVVSVVKADGQRLRSFRTDQFFIVESSDDLTQADIIAGLEENVIYLNSSIFVAGADGRGIQSITKTGTSGLVDTYTITYTDNTTSTFTVTNGAQGDPGSSIASIAKTSTSGLVDTYTITLTDGNTSTFEVTNGRDGVDLGLANIVNDLTTGGATNVLSAEMGRELAERLNNAVGVYYNRTINVSGTTTTNTGALLLANETFLIYAKCTTAVTNTNTGLWVYNGSAFTKIATLTAEQFGAGYYREYTPSENVELYVRPFATGSVDLKVWQETDNATIKDLGIAANVAESELDGVSIKSRLGYIKTNNDYTANIGNTNWSVFELNVKAGEKVRFTASNGGSASCYTCGLIPSDGTSTISVATGSKTNFEYTAEKAGKLYVNNLITQQASPYLVKISALETRMADSDIRLAILSESFAYSNIVTNGGLVESASITWADSATGSMAVTYTNGLPTLIAYTHTLNGVTRTFNQSVTYSGSNVVSNTIAEV